MMRTYFSLAVVALFLALPSLVCAQAGPESNKGDPDLKIVLKQLEEAKRDRELANQRILQLEEQVKSLQAANALVKEIRTKIAELDSALAKFQGVPSKVDSYYNKKDYSATTPGRLLLANHYTDVMTFYINDRPYVVPAQTVMIVDDVPPGRFSYKVVHAQFGVRLSNPVESLAPGQTFTLSVR